MKKILFVISILTLFAACQPSTKSTKNTTSSHSYPSAADFDLDNSDANAILIADEIMQAQGGYENWINTHYISWTFFGKRTLTWDKFTGDVRVEMTDDLKNTIIVNINTGIGKAEKDGVAITDKMELQASLEQGKSVWINDSYWLVMPFKLKDSGVTLKYLKAGKMEDGNDADILELTFKNVGDTPDNKYEIYIDKETKLVSQWSFYKSYNDEIPSFTTPWKNYKSHGNILLASDRGGNGITNIAVMESVKTGVFEEL
jgi:hypothetical protein